MQLFSSKPILKNLIPDNFIDIHSHLLPGIDDGSKNVEQTRSLLRNMNAIGIKNFITTPHIMSNVWDNDEISIRQVKEELIADIDRSYYDTFTAAAEYMLDTYFMQKMQNTKLLTLKDNYILVEMSYLNPPINLYEILFEIQLKGYKIVLAHPERYLFYAKNNKEYEKLKNAGCYFQLNLLSTVDYYGKDIRQTAEFLLSNDLIDFVGTDIHHQKHIDSFLTKVQLKNKAIPKLEKALQSNLFFLP